MKKSETYLVEIDFPVRIGVEKGKGFRKGCHVFFREWGRRWKIRQIVNRPDQKEKSAYIKKKH